MKYNERKAVLGKNLLLSLLIQKSLGNCSRCFNDLKGSGFTLAYRKQCEAFNFLFLLSLDKVQFNFLPAVDCLCLVQ